MGRKSYHITEAPHSGSLSCVTVRNTLKGVLEITFKKPKTCFGKRVSLSPHRVVFGLLPSVS